MLAELFLSVADAVISYTIDKLDPAETLKTWLKLDPAKLAFQKALARAYTAFARQYPEYAASLFDQSFLSTEAVLEISKLLIRNQHPDPALLAQLWGNSIGIDIHSEFCKRATKPASDFLSWLEAELKGEQAFQALFDSRALDSLPHIEAEIEKLTNELTRGLAAASKIASEYERITLSIGGDVKDSNVILGDGNQISVSTINNYYYSGVFDTLHDYYIPPDGVFQRVRVDEFVGRDWLTAKVDAFLKDPSRKSGAFLLIGDAGVGKTSFMAHLVKERRYLHLFAEQIAGEANMQRALQSLGSQLVTRYQIDPYKDRDTLTQLAVFPDFLERLLRIAASTLTNGEKIVIVCDALDEAGTFPDGNVFGLPNVLPDGVYFILSQRPVNTKLPNIEPLIFNLEAQGADNLQDMQTYLSAVAKRPEVAGQIRSKEYSEAFFIQTLKEKSLGVWMYLHYIIKEIESGSRAPLDLENLPTGLIGYYADYWDDWRYGRKGRGKGEEAWNNLYSPLLTTLAAAQEAITVDQLIQWSHVIATPREVTHLLSQSWRSFITEKENGEGKVYSPYHLSFRDFITGRVEFDKLDSTRANLVRDLAEQTVEAHRRIVKIFEEECKGEWEKLVKDNYPRLHLSAHLAGAKEYKKLTDLLTEGDEHIEWAEARYKKEETYAGYLNDLTHVWDYLEQEQKYALAVRCMLIENSIRSLASNIPPKLLAELVKAGIWKPARCLSVISQKTESYEQADSLKLLAPSIPLELFQEAVLIARQIKDESYRASAFVDLALYVNDELKSQALQEVLKAVREIKNEYDRASALARLVSCLNGDTKSQALHESFTTACKIKDKYDRANALRLLIPHLNDDLKIKAVQEAFTAAREIENIFRRLNITTALAPYLNIQSLQEALDLARKIKSPHHRLDILVSLASRLQGKDRDHALQEALIATCEIGERNQPAETTQAWMTLAPHLTHELKIHAFTTACEIKNEDTRARAFISLAPYLTEEARKQVLTLANNFKNDQAARAITLAAFASYSTIDIKTQILDAIPKIHTSDLLLNLVPYLSDEFKSQILEAGFTTARKIEEKHECVQNLALIVPYLTGEFKYQAIQETLAMARKINDEYMRALALADLTPYLSNNLKPQAIQESLFMACKEEENVDLIYVFTTLASHMTDDLKFLAITLAREIKDEHHRFRVLASLAPFLTGELKFKIIQEAFAAESEINYDGPFTRVKTLMNDVSQFKEDVKILVLQEALATARKIKNEYDRFSALADIVPYLTDELESETIQEILFLAHRIKLTNCDVNTLTALMPYLTKDLKSQAQQDILAAALRKLEIDFSHNVLADLLPHLSNEFKLQALALAREIKDNFSRVRALVALVPHLNEENKKQVLLEIFIAAHEANGKYNRALALAEIAPHLKDEIQIAVLHELLYLSNDYSLRKTFDIWKVIEFDGLKEHIISFVKFASQEDRENGVGIVGILTTALIHFSGQEIALELYRAIQDTARWWP